MVPAVRFVRLLVKLPMPLPLEVWLLLTVGFWEILQHTPRAVTAPPPLEVTLPPQEAEWFVAEDTSLVVTVGKELFKQRTVAVQLLQFPEVK